MKWVLEQACSQQSGDPPTQMCLTAGRAIAPASTSHSGPALAASGCPALTVLLTSLTLPFVCPGGESHPKQQSHAGLVKKLPRGLSSEERKRFAQVDQSVHPEPFAQENQCRCPAAVAGEARAATCEEAQGLGTSWDGWLSPLPPFA